jgi:hypothetical protein
MRAACGETPTTLRKNGRFVTVSHELGRTFYFRVGVEGKPEAATNTMRTDFSSWDEALAHAESLIGE